MGIYLLKFTACLAVLYFFYKLCLENENMHMFKRSYLLVSLAAALLIPALVFTEYVEVPPITNIPAHEYSIPQVTDGPTGIPVALQKEVLDIEPVLWAVYFIGVLFFGIKFLKNLIQIFKRIQDNPKQRWQQYFHVLLKEQLPPHTFLSYIFLNRSKFEADEIPKEVLLHEQTHARQKHSYDILLVEFLQVVFWMNPFIYLLKKAIKLNHEFLADQAVIKKGISQTKYQNTLLSYLSHNSFEKQESTSIANAINYSSIKKRFKLMKRHTSKKAILFRTLLLLPLLTLLMYGFSSKKIINKATSTTNEINQVLSNGSTIIKDIDVLVKENGTVVLNEEVTSIENFQSNLNKINPDLSADQTTKFVSANILTETDDKNELVSRITKELFNAKIYSISWSNINTLKSLNIYNKSNSKYHGKTLEEAELIYKEQEATSTKIDTTLLGPEWEVKTTAVAFDPVTATDVDMFNSLAKKYNSIPIKERTIPINDFALLEFIYQQMTPEQKATAQPFPNSPHHGTHQETINEILVNINEEGQLLVQDDLVALDYLKTYLAKINPHLSKQEKETLVRSVIYAPTGTSQKLINRIDAILTEYGVATINIVGPEMDIKITGSNATPKQLAEYNKLAKHYNSQSRNKMKIYKKDVERLEYLFSIMSDQQKSNAEPFPDFPKPPPAPKAPEAPNEREEAANTIQKIIEEQDPYDVVSSGIKVSGYKKPSTEILMRQPNQPTTPSQIKQDKIALQKELYEKEIIAAENVDVYQYTNKDSSGTKINLMDYLGSNDLKNAQFYFEGKEITSKKGMQLIKQNNNITVETLPHTTKQPEVKIYKKTEEAANTDTSILFKKNTSNNSNIITYYSAGENYVSRVQARILEPFKIETPPSKEPVALNGQASSIPPSPVVLKGVASSIPTPPKPISPLDHVIAMAKKDAQFIFEGKEISSDKAIELMKNNKDLNIDSRTVKGKKPVVTVSASPIPH